MTDIDDPGAAADGAAPEPEGTPSPSTVRRGRWVGPSLFAVAALALGADQASKAWAESALADGRTITVVPGAFWFELVHNPGAAFSFAPGATWVFTVVAVVAVLVIAWLSRRVADPVWAVALGLLMGGAAGNLVDRLVRAPGVGVGHVVDFLAWPNFPVFNVADSCIVCAAVLIAVMGVRGVQLDGRRVQD